MTKTVRLTTRDIAIYGAIGASVWLNGAITFRLGGKFLFESGVGVSILVALFIAVAVCLIFRSTMRWRKTPESLSVTVAVIMALPGLFGEAVRHVLFTWATALPLSAAPGFSATLFFGNAVLLTYSVVKARRAG